MTLADPKVGGWIDHEILTHDQVNAIRTELLKAIDGVGGGTYTLAAPLILNGTVEINDDLVIEASGELTIDGVLDVNGIWRFDGQGEFNDDVNVNDRWVFRSGGQCEFKAGNATQFFDLDDLAVMSDSHTYRLPLTPLSVNSDISGVSTSKWFFQSAGSGGWVQMAADSTAEIRFALPVNAGDVITNITATLIGGLSAGHGGVDPTNMPRLQLLEGPASGGVGAYSVVTTGTDAATGAGYDAAHFLTISPAYTALDRYYVLALRGEFGGTAAAAELLLVTIQANIVRKKLVSVNTFGS
jgi:hypothetical protein